MTRTARAWPLAMLILAACSREPEADSKTVTVPVPRPTPANLLPPAPAGGKPGSRLPAPELDSTGVSPGTWRSAGEATAIFADGLFSVRCDQKAQQLVFARRVGTAVPAMRIVTDTGAASFPARIANDEAIATTSLSDAFLTDILIPATSRIGITTGATTIVVPPDAIMVDAIRACRRAAGLVRSR